MTKPIIPSDIKPGDIGVCRDGTRAVYAEECSFEKWPFRFDHPRDGHYTVSEYGLQTNEDNPQPRDIIRIERIASAKPKKAKVDKDAAWILRVPVAMCGHGSPGVARRLRAIARRLEGKS